MKIKITSFNEEIMFKKSIEGLSKEKKRKAELDYEATLGSRERQLRRFEFLKNAPVEGEHVLKLNVQLKHKPFGRIIKNIKCLKCGQWGHRIGDSECPYIRINP